MRADDLYHIKNRRLACNTERVRTSPPSSCTHQHPISEEKSNTQTHCSRCFFLAFRCVLIRICLPLYNTALKSMLLHNSRRALAKSVVATRARYFISHLSPPRANREPQSTSPRSLSLEASPSPHRTPLSTSNPSPPCSRFAPPPCARTAPPAPPCTPRSPPSPPPPQRATAPFSLRFTAHRARAVVSHRDAFPPSSVAPSFRSPSRSHLRAPRSRSPAPLSPRA